MNVKKYVVKYTKCIMIEISFCIKKLSSSIIQDFASLNSFASMDENSKFMVQK